MKSLLSKLGSIGIILYWIISMFVFVLPILAMDFPTWVRVIVIVLACMFSELYSAFVSPVFWIWGLVNMVNGPQDTFAIIYYVAFVLFFLPFFVIDIVTLFKK